MPIDPHYALSGFLVGALVGVTGVGGGSLMTPILIVLFRVSPATAVGTDLLFAAATLYALISREGAVIHIGGAPEFAASAPSPRLIALPVGRALELAPGDLPPGH